MPDEKDVGYKTAGEPGKTCADCTEFKAHTDDAAMGDCHGHEVVAGGSCNYFNPKA